MAFEGRPSLTRIIKTREDIIRLNLGFDVDRRKIKWILEIWGQYWQKHCIVFIWKYGVGLRWHYDSKCQKRLANKKLLSCSENLLFLYFVDIINQFNSMSGFANLFNFIILLGFLSLFIFNSAIFYFSSSTSLTSLIILLLPLSFLFCSSSFFMFLLFVFFSCFFFVIIAVSCFLSFLIYFFFSFFLLHGFIVYDCLLISSFLFSFYLFLYNLYSFCSSDFFFFSFTRFDTSIINFICLLSHSYSPCASFCSSSLSPSSYFSVFLFPLFYFASIFLLLLLLDLGLLSPPLHLVFPLVSPPKSRQLR